jgi:hypothetical protein
MEDTIWLFLALTVALVAPGGVLAGLRRRRLGADLKPLHCSSCPTPMSLRRISIFRSHMLLGAWECPHCGNRIKSEKRVSGTAA